MRTKIFISSFIALILCSALYAMPNLDQNDFKELNAEIKGIVQQSVTQDDINKRDEKSITALIRAAGRGDNNKVEELINKGAKLDIQEFFTDWTALIYAAANGHTEIVKILVNAGAKLDVEDVFNRTALMFAAMYGYSEIVELLVNEGASLDIKNYYGDTALIYAAAEGHTKIVELLVNEGARLDIKDKYGMTALMYAVKKGHTEIITILTEADKAAKIQAKKIKWQQLNTKFLEGFVKAAQTTK